MLNKLTKECHDIAVDKGFYDCEYCNGRGEWNVSSKILNYTIPCEYCNGTKIKDRNIPELIMLVATELYEAVGAHIKGKFANFDNYYKIERCTENLVMTIDDAQKKLKNIFEKYIKNTFEDEIADTFIRLFDLCGYLDIDIEKHIRAKMEYNKTREYKHGKEY